MDANTAESKAMDAMNEFGLERPRVPDRLPPMLFLAALVHGILIIGVTFNAVLGNDFAEAISLEVTIVADPDKSWVDVEKAQYLAQASQQGDGNTKEAVRASAPLHSTVPFDNAGSKDGNSLQEALAQTEAADQLVSTRAEQDRQVADKPRDPAPAESVALLLESGVAQTLPLPQDLLASFQVQDDKPRQLVTSVDTRESRIAVYLDRWKRKIETLGVKYFPDVGLVDGITGSPTLQVTISASGQLDEALVRQSSGSKALDQAAIDILRRASPFDPFPEDIRADYDQLIFAYKWKFSDQQLQATASTLQLGQ